MRKFGRKLLLKRSPIDWSSLNVRLTIEASLLVIVGLGSVAIWMGLRMEQILLTSHTQNIEYIADRFPRDVVTNSDMMPVEVGIQKTIDAVALPGVSMWVKAPDGRFIAQSMGFDPKASKTMDLIDLAEMPLRPQIYYLGDRSLVLYQGVVNVKGQTLGKVYIVQDVTADQQALVSALQGLITICLIVLIAILFFLRFRVDRLLQPLEDISRLAGEISADDLSTVQLQFDRAPSEVKNLAQAFNLLLTRLSASWERQRQFVGDASHELRTPLTIVQGYLQSLLRRSQNLTDAQRDALETATSETERTVRLLQDLLDLARADNGQFRFRLEPLVVNELVDEVVVMARNVGDRTITIQAETIVEAQADRDRLKQVLINLIDNALNYSKPDQPVRVRLSVVDRKACVQVIDQGVGISLMDQGRVFERFYRVDEARSRGGTGLGLAIVKSLVDGMSGDLSLQSKPGEGSTFSIYLPLANVVVDFESDFVLMSLAIRVGTED
jgi:signal transduction histidine kinase